MNNIILNKTWVQGRPVVVDNLLGTAFTGEAGAHTFIIKGVDAADQPVQISGDITGKLLASNNVTVPLTGTIENGCAVVTLTQGCYYVPGKFIFSVYSTDGNVTSCLYCAVGNIFRTASDIIEYPSAAIPDVAQLIEDLQYAIDSFPADLSGLLMAIAPSFNKNTAYSAGDYVWYYGGFYKFTVDHPAGNWNPGHVVDVHLADDVADLSGAVDGIDATIGNTPMGTTATTITGAIAEHETDIGGITTQIGSTPMGTTATTITGAIKEHSDGLGDLKSAIDNIVPNIGQFEILDTTTWTSGKYVDPTSGNLANNASYSYTDYVKVLPSTDYIIARKNNVYGAFYDSSYTYLGQIKNEAQTAEAFTVTSPATAKYVRVSCITTNISYMDISIDAVKTLAPDIYIEKYSHIITVAKDGTKDYTSLRTALESIVSPSETNKYLVEFYGDGTEYDADADYTATEISNHNQGLTIPPYTTLKGIGGKEKCIIACRLTSETTNRYFSVINLSGGASMEGFTVIGDYTRNVVHQDFGTLTNVECLIKDCLLQGSNLNLAYVLAAGVLSGCKYSYENTVFENLTSGGYAYSCHNNVSFIDSAFLYFDNCRFKVNVGTTDFSFRLGSLNTNANGINCNCILKGCKIPVQLRLNQENATAYGVGILWKVSGYANDIADVHIYTSDGIDYSGNIDLLPMP